MKLYIKRCNKTESFPFEKWLREDVEYTFIDSIDDSFVKDFIIVSKEDPDFHPEDVYAYKLIILEDYCKLIQDNISREYVYNHDYFYLNHQLNNSYKSSTENIIVGSSYGAFGIELGLLNNTVNLSCISQDIYYSTRLLDLVLRKNDNIKNVVWIMAYYYFFSDLSKTQIETEISRLYKVYKPILNDSHNCVLLSPRRDYVYESDVFDISSLLDEYITEDMKENFFNGKFSRSDYASRLWEDKSIDWAELPDDQKNTSSKLRAESHNKGIRRKNNYIENVGNFTESINYCLNKGINVTVVVPPASTYYQTYLSSEYKMLFHEQMNCFPDINVIDLFDSLDFSDMDFNDMDHLNDNGAVKLTKIIAKLL